MQTLVKFVRLAPDLPAPCYQTAGAAGLDLHAAVARTMWVDPGARLVVPCGIALQIPEGYEAQVRGRSGLRVKAGIVVPVGTIDSDYRGEIACVLFNLGQSTFAIERGDRIAQLVISPVERVILDEVVALDDTARGTGGYGSTGRR